MCRTKILIGMIGALAAFGCSSSVPKELTDARRAYEQASYGPAGEYDPASLHKAKRALELAEKTYENEGNTAATRDRAYVATRQSQLATVRARTVQAETQLAYVEEDMEAQREKELKQARRQLAAQQAKLDALAKIAPTRQEGSNTIISLSGSVLFASGKADLYGPAKERLSEVARSLNTSFPKARILVKGHTDSRGSRELNMRLSQRRADAVADYLVEKGVNPDRIEARGMGFSEPIDSNRTAEGRANNRRVEIVINQALENLGAQPGQAKPSMSPVPSPPDTSLTKPEEENEEEE